MEDPDAEPSCVSIKSERSLRYLDFKDGGLTVNPREKQSQQGTSPQKPQLDDIFTRLEENIVSFVKEQLKRFHRVLASDYPECLESEEGEEQSSREAFLEITLDFLRRMKQEKLAERLQSRSDAEVSQHKLKSRLKQRFRCVFEGITKTGNPTLLNQIYTELYIIEEGAAGVNQEHEVRQIETFSRKPAAPETTITCEDIFKGPAHRQGPIRTELTEEQGPIRAELTEEQGPIRAELTEGQGPIRAELTEGQGPIRTVLTKGVAGIGKTVLTQKFILDWAEGRANQDIQLLFPFTFRELNVLRDTQFSLVGLLHHFFSESAGLCGFEHLQVVFTFDGLDECRLPLDFTRTQVLTEATESVSVDVLLVNLIRGTLLPSARLWITTRPAAANQIPAECVSMVTEVRGFTDQQKEQYFRKRFGDKQQATAVISHIKTSRSLYIMCHIPIFCWILSTVLRHLMETGERNQLPQTLTQMYIHFLVVQAKVKSLKYDGRCETNSHWTKETRKMVRALAKLAFEQLQKGNLIFYESDLSECGLDAAAASVYSGVFTQVFREEPGLYQDKVYCFIHLSVQEFLAALHVHQTFISSEVNLLEEQQPSSLMSRIFKSKPDQTQLYQSAVDQALQSPNGHLDLFLRFLLGLSLPTNQSLLLGQPTQKEGNAQASQNISEYIKKMISEDHPAEKILNLFHCLNELKDHSLMEQIQQSISGECLYRDMSPAQWSTLAFILLSSDTDLEEFNLKKYCPSQEGLQRLLPVINASNKAILSDCNLSQSCCGPLSSVLSSSSLTHLDLSNNNLQDSGVELLCSGLKSAPCRLETLSLKLCNLTQSSCGPLSSVLSSSSLTHLDLSNNDLQDSGVELLCSGLEHSPCRLETFSLSCCNLSQSCCGPLSSVLSSSSIRHLDLSNNNLQDSGVELLCSGLKSAPCRLETFCLSFCDLTESSCGHLSSVLSSSSLTHLDLNNNNLQDSGVELLCSGLKSAPCRLETLRLSGCLVSERGGASLASALSSAPSHLRELDLSYNHPGPSAELLTALRDNPHCPLDSLRLEPAGVRWLIPGLRKYFCELSLDPNTAHRNLRLSPGNRTVRHVWQHKWHLYQQDGFIYSPQVLCSTALTERCYWEVDWTMEWDMEREVHWSGFVDIAVSYKGVNQNQDSFGLDTQSWSLRVSGMGYSVRLNGTESKAYPFDSRSSGRVGVYLNCPAGFLSFYEVSSNSLNHLYTFKSTFTEPLFAGFGLKSGSVTLVGQ